MTVVFTTPPGPVPANLVVLFTSDTEPSSVSIKYVPESGAGAWDVVFAVGVFSDGWAALASRVGNEWTINPPSSAGWPCAFEVVVDASSAMYTPPEPAPLPPPVGGPTAYPQTVLRTFRDAIREISPWWLRGPIGGSILFAIGAVTDALADALRGGVKTRFPGYYSNESLPLIGRERRIRRGRVETEETYATRLIPWLDHHRIRGGPYALLAQVHAFYAPDNFPVSLIYDNGRAYVVDPADGTVLRTWVDLGAPEDPRWCRWTLYYSWPVPIEPDGIWSDPGTWDDGGVWDTNMSAELIRDIRVVPREWNAAHSIGYIKLDSDDVGGIEITISVET